MTQQINLLVTLPYTKVDLLIKFMNQNNGKLSKSKRTQEFEELTEAEIGTIEDLYTAIY